jgi:hypothetical protein
MVILTKEDNKGNYDCGNDEQYGGVETRKGKYDGDGSDDGNVE